MRILPQVTPHFKNSSQSRSNFISALAMLGLFVSHHLADFLAEHTLDFVLHRFGVGFAEMRPHKVGGLADFLYHGGRGVRLGAGGRSCLRWPEEVCLP